MTLIVGQNLKQLISRYGICPESCFDEHSISLTLSPVMLVPRAGCRVDYQNSDSAPCFDRADLGQDEYELKPGACILACSREKVEMPGGYFGLLQTKGSLARLFVSIHQSDGQIEPGFAGAITFEIVNSGPFTVVLRRHDPVGQVFIFACSTDNSRPYAGRYGNSAEPTTTRKK